MKAEQFTQETIQPEPFDFYEINGYLFYYLYTTDQFFFNKLYLFLRSDNYFFLNSTRQSILVVAHNGPPWTQRQDSQFTAGICLEQQNGTATSSGLRCTRIRWIRCSTKHFQGLSHLFDCGMTFYFKKIFVAPFPSLVRWPGDRIVINADRDSRVATPFLKIFSCFY